MAVCGDKIDGSASFAPQARAAQNDVMVSAELIVDGLFNDDTVKHVFSGVGRESSVPERACDVRRVGAFSVTEREEPSAQKVEQDD